tara:strand:+ start:231 stop:500 length:270 start_codon:yes stop_codon:yes gene_type:complete
MIGKIRNIFFLLVVFVFIYLTTSYYFSEKNIILTNKIRLLQELSVGNNYKNLPILKNDTANIVKYKNGIEEYKKKRKKRFWEQLISNDD